VSRVARLPRAVTGGERRIDVALPLAYRQVSILISQTSKLVVGKPQIDPSAAEACEAAPTSNAAAMAAVASAFFTLFIDISLL
jgi:hypothetical protein